MRALGALLLRTLDAGLRYTPGGWLVARWHARRVRRAFYGVTPVRFSAFQPITAADIESAEDLASIVQAQIAQHIAENGADLPAMSSLEVQALQDWLMATRDDGYDMRVIDSLLALSSLPDGSPASVLSLPADVTPEGVRPLCLCQCGHIYADECGCLYAQMLIPPEDRRPVWPDEMKIPRP